MEWSKLGLNILQGLVWAITGGLCMAIVAPIALKIFDWVTKDIDEFEELKKGNIAVAIVFFGVLLAIGLVVAAAIN